MREKDYEKLKSNILAMARDRQLFSLAVMGSQEGEGVTTVAANLARSLAASTANGVLLVDANLRRPALGDRFALAPDLKGLTDIAVNGHDPAEVAVEVAPGLFCVTAGRRTMTADLRAVLDRFLDLARQRYGAVIIDGPPVATAPESLPLAAAVDGVVLAIHAGRTRREVVQETVRQLRLAGANLLGVVLARRRYAIPDRIYRRL